MQPFQKKGLLFSPGPSVLSKSSQLSSSNTWELAWFCLYPCHLPVSADYNPHHITLFCVHLCEELCTQWNFWLCSRDHSSSHQHSCSGQLPVEVGQAGNLRCDLRVSYSFQKPPIKMTKLPGGGGKSAPLNFQGVKGKPLSEPLKRTGRSNPHGSLSALIINPHAHLFVLYVPVWHGKQTLKIIWFLAGLYEFKWYECACTFLQRLMLEGLGARHSIQGVALPTN